MRRGGAAAIAEAERFFMRSDAVHRTLGALCERLNELGIPHAIAGGMALVAHGYDRTTVDVDVLITADGLRQALQALSGRGYMPAFEGSRSLRDTQTGVRIEFLVAGQFPGDGKPKPVAFPDPVRVATEIDGISYVALPALIELKLASGMTHPGRLKDLADVQELIRVLRLPADFGERLHTFVRPKFAELHQAVQPDRVDPLE